MSPVLLHHDTYSYEYDYEYYYLAVSSIVLRLSCVSVVCVGKLVVDSLNAVLLTAPKAPVVPGTT